MNFSPLAEQLRPKNITEVIGQSHLLAEGQALYTAYTQNLPHSMVFWGPPGVGKTTLAYLLAERWGAHIIKLSAVFSGVKEIREAIAEAEYQRQYHGKNTVLFVDEIHRFNKSQQDAFLPHVESGLLTLIGATTENPSFELNSALLSRLQVYVLNPLTQAELIQLYERAKRHLPNTLTITPEALTMLIDISDGDARRFLNLLELSSQSAAAKRVVSIDPAFLQSTLPANLRRFDKGGDVFYDQISALHKAVRGSHPDAALYWLSRMLDGGADPLYLARRIIRMAWEDIGLADLRCLDMVNAAAATYERLGSPEGELALATAVIYLALAPKSNAAYVAYKGAQAFVKKTGSYPVPLRFRNAPTKLMKDLAFGQAYRYVHNEAHHYAAGENYFPDDLEPQTWYTPTDQGLESKIKEKLAFLKRLDQEAKGNIK